MRRRLRRRPLGLEPLECRNLLAASFGQFTLAFETPINQVVDGRATFQGSVRFEAELTALNPALLSQVSVGAVSAEMSGEILENGNVVGSFAATAAPLFDPLFVDSGVHDVAGEQEAAFTATLANDGQVSGSIFAVLDGELDLNARPPAFDGTVLFEIDEENQVLSDFFLVDQKTVVAEPAPLFPFDKGLSSLADRVWSDIDGDGQQDAGEPGRPGVTVQLVDTVDGAVGGDLVVASGVTDANGNYSFLNVDPGDYYVQLQGLFPGLNVGPLDVGGDEAVDNDFLAGSLRTEIISLGAAPTHLQTVDAGVVAGSPFQNIFNPLNVDEDPLNLVTSEDLLAVLNDLLLNGARNLLTDPPLPATKVDVDGDGNSLPDDLAAVLGALVSSVNGEGESLATRQAALAAWPGDWKPAWDDDRDDDPWALRPRLY